MMKVVTYATVPDELAQKWLQHLRDFDTAHPGCTFEVITDAHDYSMKQVIEMMRVHPEVPLRDIIIGRGNDTDRRG